MSRTVTIRGRNLDVYTANGTKFYTETGYIKVIFSDVTGGETGWDLWFAIHDTSKYKFERTENNSTDYIIAPFNTTNNPIKIYANGNHIYYGSDPSAYASFSWDANKYGGSYHFEVSPKGNNDSFWWDKGQAEITLGIGLKENTAPQYDVVYNLSNCTVSPQPEKMVDGTKYELTFTPASGYKYDVGPKAVWQDGYGISHEGTLDGNVLTLTPTDVMGSINITATAIKAETPKPEYDVVYNLSNCTVSPQPEKMVDGTKYELTFNLASGYKYDVEPKAVWKDEIGVSHEGTLNGNVLTLTPTDVMGSIKITATAIKDTPTTEYGTARVYRVTDSTMDSISEWAANQAETFDISKYIYTLRKFFFDVVAEANATIRFGRYDTKVAAKLVENDEFEIDCGTISIEGVYNNAIDYDSDIEFYLPFVGPISVPTNRVMDSTVSLVYHVNVFNGDCVASLYVNDIEVGRANGNISYEVPYTNTESYSKNIGTVPPQYLANLTPSVTISTPIAETTGVIGQRSIVTIGNLKGFAKFDNIQSLVIDGTKGEIDMIKSLLESGVYIA